MTLPPGWAFARIDELIGVHGLISDGDWVESKDQDPNGEVRLTQLADVGEGNFRDKSARFMTTKSAESLGCTYLQAGDVLIARMPDPIGRACMFPGLNRPAVTAVDVMIVRSDGVAADARWLVKWINSPNVRAAMADGAGGTTRQRIAGGRIKEMELPLPPLAEQNRIVATLAKLTARLTSARDELDRVAAMAKRLRDAAYLDVFSGTSKRLPLEAITPKNAPIIYGILQPGPEIAGGVPYVRPTEIRNHEIDLRLVRRTSKLIADQYRRATIRSGDIILTIVGTIGKVALVPEELDGGNITQSSCRIRCDGRLANNRYLRHWLRSPDAWRQYDAARLGTAVPRLNIRDIRGFLVPMPALHQQLETADQLDLIFARADRLEAEAARARALLDRLEAAILARAYRGELVPQDPADEPATALLDRIRAERAATPKPKRGRRRKDAV